MNHLKILFWLRKSEKQKKMDPALAEQKISIYCRVTVNGESPVEISTGEYIEYSNWLNQRAIGSKREIQTINNRLDNIRTQIKDVFNKLEEKGGLVTASAIRDLYNGKPSEKRQNTLLSIFDAYLKDCEKLVLAQQLSPVTLQKKESIRKNIELFIKDFYGKNDILLDHLLTSGHPEFSFAYDFMLWGKTKELFAKESEKSKNDKKIKPLWDHNHCAKQLSITSHAIDFGVIKGIINRNPFYKKIPTPNKKPAKCLPYDAVTAIENYTPKTDTIETIKDIFLFSCYTGLAFREAEALAPANLTILLNDKNKDNPKFTKYWLFINRQKTLRSTGRVCKIPLLKKAYDILEKYKDHPVCINRGKLLPVPSNPKYNEYLKTIQDLCSIEQNLTTHIARHTCSRIFLDNKFTKDFVAEMFGHSSTKYIGTIYAEITTNRMESEVEERGNNPNASFA